MPTSVQLVTSGKPSSLSCKYFSSYSYYVLGEAQREVKAKGDPRDGPGGTRAPLRRVALSKVVMLKTRSSQKATWAAQAPRR